MADIFEVFSGTSIDANFIKAFLEDNGIGVIVENKLQSSISAGWVDTSTGNVSVMVAAKNFEKAEALVREYLAGRDKES